MSVLDYPGFRTRMRMVESDTGPERRKSLTASMRRLIKIPYGIHSKSRPKHLIVANEAILAKKKPGRADDREDEKSMLFMIYEQIRQKTGGYVMCDASNATPDALMATEAF